MSPWIWLFLAICFEVAATSFLKLSFGFSKVTPSILTTVFYLVCFVCLAISLKKLDVSIAYAIWAGLGTALIAFIGFWHFGEQVSLIKVISLALVIIGVVGLNISASFH